MGWHRDITEATVEDLARRNSPLFMAGQWQRACQHYLEAIDQHARDLRDVKTQLSDAQRIGLRVLAAERAGRKTLRISDLTGGTT